jgi:hypothetical protein
MYDEKPYNGRPYVSKADWGNPCISIFFSSTRYRGINLLPSRQKIKDGLTFKITISAATTRSAEKP